MVLFLAAVGLILFFGGVVAAICEPPRRARKLIGLVIFSGTVLIGGAAYVAYMEETYRESQLWVWDSVEEIEKRSPIRIGEKWYKIVLIETNRPEEDNAD